MLCRLSICEFQKKMNCDRLLQQNCYKSMDFSVNTQLARATWHCEDFCSEESLLFSL
jgi:hypothetical protein